MTEPVAVEPDEEPELLTGEQLEPVQGREGGGTGHLAPTQGLVVWHWLSLQVVNVLQLLPLQSW